MTSGTPTSGPPSRPSGGRARATATAVSRPMPELPPVMTTVFPDMSRGVSVTGADDGIRTRDPHLGKVTAIRLQAADRALRDLRGSWRGHFRARHANVGSQNVGKISSDRPQASRVDSTAHRSGGVPDADVQDSSMDPRTRQPDETGTASEHRSWTATRSPPTRVTGVFRYPHGSVITGAPLLTCR